MLRFRVNEKVVAPIICKYFGSIYWNIKDIDCTYCYYSMEHGDIGFDSKEKAYNRRLELTALLSNPITFARKTAELEEQCQEELIFLAFYIHDAIHSSLNDQTIDTIYSDLLNNYIKVRAFIKQFKLENPSASENQTGLEINVRPKGTPSLSATFDNLDVYFNFNEFLIQIERQVSFYLPEQIRKQLDNPNLSLSRIKELYNRPKNSLENYTGILKAKGALALREYLLEIFPFSSAAIKAKKETRPEFSNDQIRLIYALYYVMGLEEKPDKSQAYIKSFRKRVYYHYDNIVSSIDKGGFIF